MDALELKFRNRFQALKLLVLFFFLACESTASGGDSSSGFNVLGLEHRFSDGSPVVGQRPTSLREFGKWVLEHTRSRGSILRLRAGLTQQPAQVVWTGSFSASSGEAGTNLPQKPTTLPLGGGAEELGLYFTSVGVGSPPQFLPANIDTGSALTWLQCNGCTNCTRSKKVLPYFPARSSTSRLVGCNLCDSVNAESCTGGITCAFGCTSLGIGSDCLVGCSSDVQQTCNFASAYGDGSYVAGKLRSDMLTLRGAGGASVSASGVLLGCDYAESSGALIGPIIGLLGLSRGTLSLPSQLAQKGAISGDVVSHCLGGGAVNLGDTSGYLPAGSAGFLTFGTPPKAWLKGTQFVRMGSDPSLHNISLSGVSVSGTRLPVSSRVFSGLGFGAVIDSGSTTFTLPTQAHAAVKRAIAASVKGKAVQLTKKQIRIVSGGGAIDSFDLCYRTSISPQSLAKIFPVVTLLLSGGSLPLYPANYLWLFTLRKASYACYAGLDADSDYGSGLIILGDIALRNKLVIYDRQNQRMGFRTFNCSTSSA